MEFAPLTLGPSSLDRIIGQSAPMRELKRNIERAAHCQCILFIRAHPGRDRNRQDARGPRRLKG
jgi:transcriptional regulator with GAF, ATPase, and Fis domain